MQHGMYWNAVFFETMCVVSSTAYIHVCLSATRPYKALSMRQECVPEDRNIVVKLDEVHIGSFPTERQAECRQMKVAAS